MGSNKKIKAIWLAEEFVFDGEGNIINGLELIGEPLDLTITSEAPVIEFTIPRVAKNDS